MARQLPLELPHHPSLARDDLVVSAANRLVVDAIDAWPDWPHPVLLVSGPPGSGKSHLACVWAGEAGAVTADRDTVGEIIAMRDFRVVVDDVDAGKLDEPTLFSLVNAARLGGGSVFLTSRSLPSAMTVAMPDLRSRLAAATAVLLGAPDDSLLTGVLAKLFADRQLEVEPGALRYLVERMERSLDAARRIVAAVDREALAVKGRVTRPLLRRVLEEGTDENSWHLR
ncbi:hypothetical protein LQ948_06385 [Jiella sp. MQZ9-1]|uniref:Hda lid domain-containing protein n=1 Tax=Jiella flava TaxID=2816857 RepID=A0A939FYH6_9HYPH|nr:DnaA/Hda family protein [Jiella flava]MBO0662338.1 hypothetical protein [Jiella flava]MCD2470833.1 hypothetical protein [Jiella flava]